MTYKGLGYRWCIGIILSIILLFPLTTGAQSVDLIKQYIELYYPESASEELLEADSIESIINALDPYSSYFEADEYQSFLDSFSNEFGGIGVQIEASPIGIKIITVFQGGPADKAGLQPGDVIIGAEGSSLVGVPIELAVQMIRGKIGSQVQITVMQAESEKAISISLTREQIVVPTVTASLLGGDIGYIRINSFNDNTIPELKQAINVLGAVSGTIIDLRDNGGGYLHVAQKLVGFFPEIEYALLVKEGEDNYYLYAALRQSPDITGSVALLINNRSASASEIVAAALKDYEVATLYGQQTFGKGSMQQIFPLGDQNGFLKLTTAYFYSPLGMPIASVGVAPDVLTEPGEELSKAHLDLLLTSVSGYSHPSDPQIEMFIGEIELFLPRDVLATIADVSLIQLGGNAIEADYMMSHQSINIQADFENDQQYLLLLHPYPENASGLYVAFNFEAFEDRLPLHNMESDQGVRFTDINQAPWASHYILHLSKQGILRGQTEHLFGPLNHVTRADFAVMLTRMLGLIPGQTDALSFTDISSHAYFASSIAAVYREGLMSGRAIDRFDPYGQLTREEAAVIISRILRSNGAILEAPEVLDSFFDKELIASWARDSVAVVISYNIMGGTAANVFEAKGIVNRAQAAAILYRLAQMGH
jgi:carboxyl-terminal processing protease